MTIEKAIWAMNFYREKLYNGIFNQYIDAFDAAIAALRAQQEAEQNAPLTLDELREMEGEPVYLSDLCEKDGLWEGWIVFTSYNQYGFIPRGGGLFCVAGYGKNWLAYRRKPEEGM